MPIRGKLYLSFRLRLLLALIAMAGAGVYLTYSGIIRSAGPFLHEEAGDRLFSTLNLAASLLEGEVNSGIEKAKMTAARTGVRAILARLNSGGALPADRDELQKRLQDAIQASPDIAALELVNVRGAAAAAAPKAAAAHSFSRTADLRPSLTSVSVSAPRGGRGTVSYDITVPVPPLPGTPGTGPLGALHCRIISAALPQYLLAGNRGSMVFTLGRRQGDMIKVTGGAGGDREIPLKSPEAAPFLPAMEGKEGFTVIGGDGGKAIYAYRRLSYPEWIITAGVPYSQAEGRGDRMLKEVRLNALLAFALLAIAALIGANLLILPITRTARSAAALLEDCGKPTEEPNSRPEAELVDEALAEAAALIKTRTTRGTELESETEKLREEETDLKYQNAELEKLNKYLSEREVKISELKKEIADLKEKVGVGVSE